MKKTISFAFIFLIALVLFTGTKTHNNKISERLQKAISYSQENKLAVYIYFNDKGPDAQSYLAKPLSLVTERSLERRKKVLPPDALVEMADVPLYQPYVEMAAGQTTRLRNQLRWLNCVSADVTIEQIDALAKMNCVKNMDLVEKFKKSKDENQIGANENRPVENTGDNPLVDTLDYGTSLAQSSLIKVNLVHDQGIFGQKIIIGHFDAGYLNLNHEAFTTLPMKILHRKDFHTGDTVNIASHSHGQATLSLVGGYKPGQLISPAFMSSFLLCRTEVDPTETPIEMDHWIAAAQWVDSLGADVISSSLGYRTFDSPYTSYTWQDMNGHTLPISIAAGHAAHVGILVSNSAGNDGQETNNTLGGPADADSILTVGALNSDGTRASYSSVGPTTDVPARFKPDIMTQGSGNKVADQTGYNMFGSGTSWACPMNAGVAALMLSANRNLTPLQIIGIVHKFGSNSTSPNNLIGWGTLNAQLCVDSARKLDNTAPAILHTQPFATTTDTSAKIFKAVISDNGIIRYTRSNEAPRIYFRKNTGGGFGTYTSANFYNRNLDTFYFKITGSPLGTTVEYYIAAQDIALPTPKITTVPAGGSGVTPPGTTAPGTRYSYTVQTTSVIATGSDVPNEFRLFNNYPNPFNPSTLIKFEIAKPELVTLKIYDIAGRLVRLAVNERLNAGTYQYQFDAEGLSSGLYIYQINAGTFRATNKMLLVK
ncbi:MAG: S8 family serine peptidase [Ignavibacteria bacterium]|nr:S8 family serine peptidase [Ignavibacteria bacterium]